MREAGWTGGRMEKQRRVLEKQIRRTRMQRNIQDNIANILGINSRWWGDPNNMQLHLDEDSDDEDADGPLLVRERR